LCTTFANVSPVTFPTAPKTEVTAKGDIVYSEAVRENIRILEAYVKEMASGDTTSGTVNIQKAQDDVLELWTVAKSHQGTLRRSSAIFEGGFRTNSYTRYKLEAADLHFDLCCFCA
jgi:fatty acid synthase subunit beta